MVSVDSLPNPAVVATVTRNADLWLLAGDHVPTADVLEYRIDNLYDDLKALDQLLERGSSLPSLFTVRSHQEGGARSMLCSDRLELYQSYLTKSRLIDIEVVSLLAGSFDELLQEARQLSVEIVGSFHDFNQWPGVDVVRDRISQAYDQGADIAKVAVYMPGLTELWQLTQLVEEFTAAGRRVSAMGMGPMGKLSRLVLAKAGSVLNYGYLQEANAPGQWSAADLKKLVAEI